MWRQRYHDLEEATMLLARSENWLSRRAFAKQERLLANAEAKIDQELDGLIRKHRLEEAWTTFQAIDHETWAEIDRVMDEEPSSS